MPVDVPFAEKLIDTHLVVDVRTPLEYLEDHVPGAINVPLLENDERVEIGILHKHAGPNQARLRGLELTAGRFPRLVAEIAEAAQGRPILVYCWRGGLRSKTVASILDLTGFPAARLQGGYKSFRNRVTSFFSPFCPTVPLVVIHGLTGIGKTSLLHRLDGEHYTVVDLEGLARHRGSAFGELGLSQDLSQKYFESLLWDAFRRSPPGRPVIVEGESRRIGRLSLPGDLYEAMQAGIKVWCEAPLETRVDRLIEEYGKPEYKEGMAESLQKIRKRLGGEKYEEIAGHLERWDLRPFMAELLVGYYDKVYYKTREWREDKTISLGDYEAAARELDEFLRSQPG